MRALRGPPRLSDGGAPFVAPLATVRRERLHGWVAVRGRRRSSATRPFDPPTPHVAVVPGVPGGSCACSALLRRSTSLRGGPTAELAPLGGRCGLCRRGAGKGRNAPCRGRRACGGVRPPPPWPPIFQAMRECRVIPSARGPRRSSHPTAPCGMGVVGEAVGGRGLPCFDARGRPAASQISSPSPRILSPLSTSSQPLYET
jgi:hypothetical protein